MATAVEKRRRVNNEPWVHRVDDGDLDLGDDSGESILIAVSDADPIVDIDANFDGDADLDAPLSGSASPSSSSPAAAAAARGTGGASVISDDECYAGVDDFLSQIDTRPLAQQVVSATLSHVTSVVLEVQRYYTRVAADTNKHCRVRRRADVAADPLGSRHQSSGYMKLEAIERQLDRYGEYMRTNIEPRLGKQGNKRIARSREQVEFHRHYIDACLPQIFKDDWGAEAARVMAERGITEIPIGALVMTPRRFGKSWGIAMLVAALLIYCPGIKIAIFARNKRQTKWMAQLVKKFIQLAGAGERILSFGDEVMEVGIKAKRDYGMPVSLIPEADKSTLEYYPDNVDGTCCYTHIRTHAVHGQLLLPFGDGDDTARRRDKPHNYGQEQQQGNDTEHSRHGG
jgi:hypothetical protein